MYRNLLRIFSLSLLAALAPTGCGSDGSSSLLVEGVAGPFASKYFGSKSLTELQRPEAASFYTFSTIVVQTVINGLVVGNTVTAKILPSNTQKSFVAPESGNLGLVFELDPPPSGWPTGTNTAVVNTGSRQIGSISIYVTRL